MSTNLVQPQSSLWQSCVNHPLTEFPILIQCIELFPKWRLQLVPEYQGFLQKNVLPHLWDEEVNLLQENCLVWALELDFEVPIGIKRVLRSWPIILFFCRHLAGASQAEIQPHGSVNGLLGIPVYQDLPACFCGAVHAILTCLERGWNIRIWLHVGFGPVESGSPLSQQKSPTLTESQWLESRSDPSPLHSTLPWLQTTQRCLQSV